MQNSKQPFNQAHNAEVAAAHAALEAQEFAALDHMDASFSSCPSFSTEMPSSGATEGNTEATEGNTDANSQLGAVDVTSRCTTRISRPHSKELRHHQDKHNATVLAVARAWNARTDRPPSATGRCLQSEFRAFAFESGRRYLQEGNLETAKLSAVIRAFEELHPNAPPSLKIVLNPLSPGKSGNELFEKISAC